MFVNVYPLHCWANHAHDEVPNVEKVGGIIPFDWLTDINPLSHFSSRYGGGVFLSIICSTGKNSGVT